MKVYLSFKLEEYDVALLQSGGEPLYIHVRGGLRVYLAVKALLLDGWISLRDYEVLLGLSELSLPVAAAVAPDRWRSLLFLCTLTQPKTPGEELFLPSPNLAAASLLSLPRDRGLTVAVEADGADPHLLVRAAALSSAIEILNLVYRGRVAELPPLDYVRIVPRVQAMYFLSRSLPSPYANAYARTVEWPLVPEDSSRHRLLRFEAWEMRVKPPLQLPLRIDLLKLAFGERAKAVTELLDEVSATSVVQERALLDWLYSLELEAADYYKLLEYGYLSRSVTTAAMVSVTDKGLYALAFRGGRTWSGGRGG